MHRSLSSEWPVCLMSFDRSPLFSGGYVYARPKRSNAQPGTTSY